MNAQRFQQVRTDVRRTIARHTLALGLALLILIVALVAQRYTAPQATVTPAASRPNPAPITSQGWPGATLTGSAYNGQSEDLAHTTAPVAQGCPGATLTGSAYNGRSVRSSRLAVPSSGWPGATLMGSAYDGQTSYPMRLAPAAQQGWPGATLTGSAYDGR